MSFKGSLEGLTAAEGLKEFIERGQKQGKKTVLDIGCGKPQLHANVMRLNGFDVKTCDFFEDNDYQGLFTDLDFEGEQFDMVWAAHVLEHQTDVGAFLRKINTVLKDDGLLCITVPPLKHKIVGGHLTLWNLGLMYYNLILAGFDCRKGVHKAYRYNLSVIINKKQIEDMPELHYDNGDIELLEPYFPFKAVQGFDGQLSDTF